VQHSPPAPRIRRENPISALLASGKAVFGAFSGEKTKENATKLSRDNQLDFVFYDMETGPFDVDGMRDFMASLGSRPIATRLPPIREGSERLAGTRSAFSRPASIVVFPTSRTGLRRRSR
jgi:hypothetical protein